MPKRICWKKGMRLTDDVLRASDDANNELISLTMTLASAGRFGLFPIHRHFNVALNFNKGFVEVESLSCLAITKGGYLIDVDYESKYDIPIDNKVQLPEDSTVDDMYLTINARRGQWKESADGYEEPMYDFSLFAANTPLGEQSFPIAHLVNNEYGGWHIDDIDFVPPCLFITSHHKYEELFCRFQEALASMNVKARTLIHSEAGGAMRLFWPVMQQIMITADKERNLMTPMSLLEYVQRYICAFATACELDEHISLSDADLYFNYAHAPYNYQNVYQKIREGLEICFSVYEKIDKIQANVHQEPPQEKTSAPYINEDQLYQNCRNKSIKIPVNNPTPDATVYYSTDGSEPKKKLTADAQLTIENDFNKQKIPEPDKTLTVKLKSVLNGVSSEVNTYTVTLHKDYKLWDGKYSI